MPRNSLLNIEYVREKFKENNLILISEEYVGCFSNLKYICSFHPEKVREITWHNFRRSKSNCQDCGYGLKKYSIADVIIEFEIRGLKLLEKEYINSGSKLRFVCPSHQDEVQSISFDHLKSGKGCRFCSYEKRKTPFERVYSDFENIGYILLESKEEYTDIKRKMKCLCLKHPNEAQYISYHSVKQGHEGCSYCISEKRTGKNSPRWKGGIKLLSDYLRDKLTSWRKESLKKYNYTCFITGIEDQNNLEVHHTELFHEIRDSVIEKLEFPIYETIGEYSQEELDSIVPEIIKRHMEIEGIPMLNWVHILFHKIYGMSNISINDVHEFKQRYLSGEFNNLNKEKDYVQTI